jgi:hypothetical protein
MIGKFFSRRFPLIFWVVALLLVGQRHGWAQSHTLPWLTADVVTNGQIKVTLATEPGVSRYVIESSPDLKNWMSVATNIDSTNTRSITLAAPDNLYYYRAVRNLIPVFGYALAARGNIDLNGNAVVTDSYNSYDTNLSSNGLYDPAKISTNGSVASVSGLVNIGNDTIAGSLYLGLTASYVINSGSITGNIYPNANFDFPDVVLPIPPSGIWTSAPVSGSGPNLNHTFTNSGYYRVSDSLPVIVNAGVTVTLNVTNSAIYTPASIEIRGGTTNSGTAIFYLNGPSNMSLWGNTPVNFSNRPENLRCYCLPSLTSISFGNTTVFVGTIYAPEADVTLNGGFKLIGSLVVNSCILDSHPSIHYDESLLTLGPFH